MQCVSERDCSVSSSRMGRLVPGIAVLLLVVSCIGLCYQKHHYSKKIAEMEKTIKETQMVEGAPAGQPQTGLKVLE